MVNKFDTLYRHRIPPGAKYIPFLFSNRFFLPRDKFSAHPSAFADTKRGIRKSAPISRRNVGNASILLCLRVKLNIILLDLVLLFVVGGGGTSRVLDKEVSFGVGDGGTAGVLEGEVSFVIGCGRTAGVLDVVV